MGVHYVPKLSVITSPLPAFTVQGSFGHSPQNPNQP